MDLLTSLGPDTVDLVIREPADPPAVDAWGQPVLVERQVTKSRCSWQTTGGTEEIAGTVIATLEARGALVVDADTRALDSRCAVRHAGRLFELSTPAVVALDGFGRESHVRVFGRWADDVSLGEFVTVVPAGGRKDGLVLPDGAPIALKARAVLPGDQRVKFGATGPSIEAAYTVVLDLDAPVRNGDWLLVRGRECRALVERQESQWTERRQLVALAQYRGGGRT